MKAQENSEATKNEARSSSSSFQSPAVLVQYSDEEERKLVRKLDLHILPVVILLYLFNFIDRSSIGNAKIAGLEKNIGLVGYQYNIGLSIFYIVYALSEVPSNLLLKRFGADKWIPFLVTGFGLVSFCTAFIKDHGGFVTVRAFLGLLEGGMLPGVTYYLSTYYKRHELVFRIGVFTSAANASGAFGGLLASGLLKLPQIKGLRKGRWRNIFFVEGMATIVLGLAGFFLLPGPAKRTKFLNERERMIAIQRLVNDDEGGNTAGANGVRDDSWWRAFKSLNTWICAICFLFTNMTAQGIALFMPSLLKGMGYSVIHSQLLTVPPYVVAAIFTMGCTYYCFRSGRRGMWLLLVVPLAIIGLAILLTTSNVHANYAAVFLVTMGSFAEVPILLSWVTNNTAPNTVRAVSSAMVVSIGTIGPIISSWIYLPRDAPRYHTANVVEITTQVALFILVSILMYWNTRENKRRAQGERDYRLNASDEVVSRLGSLHPKFRLIV